jgi:hypothetical protein
MKRLLFLLAAGLAAATCDGSSTTNTESPPLTNFSSALDRSQYMGITWGKQTNNIQFGLALPYAKDQLSPNRLRVCTYFVHIGPVGRSGLIMPPRGHRLDISLMTTNGTQIARTAAGVALCKPVPSNLNSVGQHRTIPAGTVYLFEYPFNLIECFKLKQPGTYILSVKPRLFATLTSPDNAPIDLPAARIEVEVNLSDLEK